MLTLYRCGRQTDALEVYQHARVYLAAELGLEPGPMLKKLESEILRQAPSLDVHTSPSQATTDAAETPAIPQGTVTMMFTDIEGSTGLLHQLGDGYGELLALHAALIADACRRHEGVEIADRGDGLFLAFRTPRAALEAAVEAQDALARTSWPSGADVRVRIGIHTGEPRVRGDTYWGEDVNYAARLADAANGGQTLVSAATAALVPEAALVDLGEHRLKDFPAPRRLLQLGVGDHPPLRTPDPLRSNLPTVPVELIGREREREELLALLRSDDCRLVTVTGAGGVGKTSLALAVTETLLGEFPDGAFFVSLAEVPTAEGVSAAIAGPLGITAGEGSDLGERIAAGLANRRLLLFLDNSSM